MVEWSGRYRYHTVDPTHSPLKAAPLVSYLSLFHFILVYYRLGWVGLGWVGLDVYRYWWDVQYVCGHSFAMLFCD